MARYDLATNHGTFSDPNAWLNESSGLTNDGSPGAADTAVINDSDATVATGSGDVATLEADIGFSMDALTLTTSTITGSGGFDVTLNNNSSLTVSGTVTFTGAGSFIDAASGVLTTNGAIVGNGAITGGMEVDPGAVWIANATVGDVRVLASGDLTAGVLDNLVNLQIGGGTATAGAVSVQQYVVVQSAQATLGDLSILGAPPPSLSAIEIATQATVSTGNITGNTSLTPGGPDDLEILQASTLKVSGSISLLAALRAQGSSLTTVTGDVKENNALVGGTDASGRTTTLSVGGNFDIGTGAAPVPGLLSSVTAGGSLFVGGVLTIGADAGWNSTLQVNDDTADVVGTTALAGIVNTPSIDVGAAGIGTLDFESGGRALVGTMTIGNGAQPDDTVIADGNGSGFDASGTVTVSTASVTLESGGDASFDSLNLVGASQVTLETADTTGTISVGASSTIAGTGTLFAPAGPTSGASVNDGVVAADGGALVLLQHWSGGGTFSISPFSTLDVHKGGLDSGTANVAFDPSGGAGTLFIPNTGLMPTIENFAPGDRIDLYDSEITGLTYTPGAGGTGGTLLVGMFANPNITIAFSGSYTNGQFLYSNNVAGLPAGDADIYLACYAEGTRIQTRRGSIAVENLNVGDRVVTRARPEGAPVVWLGHRAVDCGRHPRPQEVWPVCIRAGAFAPGLPHRDLWLSPDHAVFTDAALVPVRYLVNGSTILQVACAEITWFHVELPAHGVLLAEGLPCESYLDTGNRCALAGGDATTIAHAEYAPSGTG